MPFRCLKSPLPMPKFKLSLASCVVIKSFSLRKCSNFLFQFWDIHSVNMEFGSGIPGDGRCLFRSVVHGACLRAGKPSPSESQEKELADDLRAAVADEFIKRRSDTEWFVEGDFDTYVAKMRQPHVWGGEPELLMASYVLQLPITVHMWDKKKNCLQVIAEYGQEYGKENPIRVLYHGYGHYDALQTPSDGLKSKLSKRW